MSWRRSAGAAVALLASLGLYAAVRASGAPATSMVYAGVATQNGVPLAGAHLKVVLSVFDQATQLCTLTSTPTADAAGGFTAPLNASCNDLLRSDRPLELQVDLSMLSGGPVLSVRRQLAAVPFAVEALHAQRADEAVSGDQVVAGGALEQRLIQISPGVFPFDGGAGPLYDLTASFCGATPAVDGALHDASHPQDNASGYAGTTTVCISSLVCAGEGHPHLCTAEELVRSQALGRVPAAVQGWYAGGVHPDCEGFSSNDGGQVGLYWAAGGQPSELSCSGSYPLLCCK